MATAYRRKRMMEGLLGGDKEVTQQMLAMAEERAAAAAAQARALARSASSRSTSGGGCLGPASGCPLPPPLR
jgi:hypothetical protein